jgi:hypothetical protein
VSSGFKLVRTHLPRDVFCAVLILGFLSYFDFHQVSPFPPGYDSSSGPQVSGFPLAAFCVCEIQTGPDIWTGTFQIQWASMAVDVAFWLSVVFVLDVSLSGGTLREAKAIDGARTSGRKLEETARHSPHSTIPPLDKCFYETMRPITRANGILLLPRFIGICEKIDLSLFTMPCVASAMPILPSSSRLPLSAVTRISFVPGLSPSFSDLEWQLDGTLWHDLHHCYDGMSAA